MIIQEPAQFINEFIESINALIQKKNPIHSLSRKQRVFLAFCIMGIIQRHKFKEKLTKNQRISSTKYPRKKIFFFFFFLGSSSPSN